MNIDKSQLSYSWQEIADLTHETQVDIFGWCSCEEQKQFPYDDCPRKCDDCESEITLTLEAYGNGQLMRIDCPQCGVSYDTNLDPIEGERASK